jgi:hypothetical protein
MAKRPSKQGISTGILVVLLAGVLVSSALQAGATHQPADKLFAAASKTVRFSPGAGTTLLTATVKNSKPADIILQVAMECSIITDNVIAGSTVPGAQESAATEGTVRIWIEVDGAIVPIISSSTPPQNPPPPGDETDKVTFCNRVFNRTVQDAEDPEDGYDRSRDYIETKTSNAFNWVRLNMGSGIHTIVVKGDLSHFSTTGSSASAFVGNRSLIGIPGKFSNDVSISESGTS